MPGGLGRQPRTTSKDRFSPTDGILGTPAWEVSTDRIAGLAELEPTVEKRPFAAVYLRDRRGIGRRVGRQLLETAKHLAETPFGSPDLPLCLTNRSTPGL
jgi:hypothetical protein